MMTFDRLSYRSLELIRRWNRTRRLAVGMWPTVAAVQRYRAAKEADAKRLESRL